MATRSTHPNQQSANAVGYAGLLPFAACAALSWVQAWHELALQAGIAYGAVILSFVGAVHWGAVIVDRPLQGRRLWLASVPALLGWLALLLTPLHGISLLIAAFAGWWLLERQWHWPYWYRALRTRLSISVITLLLITQSSLWLELSGA
ncbi:MAG: hypothetical protein Tsb002_14270 [Wenzhouxiangellaceae bacterium]